jgi:SAM-dependent methyltransferase
VDQQTSNPARRCACRAEAELRGLHMHGRGPGAVRPPPEIGELRAPDSSPRQAPAWLLLSDSSRVATVGETTAPSRMEQSVEGGGALLQLVSGRDRSARPGACSITTATAAGRLPAGRSQAIGKHLRDRADGAGIAPEFMPKRNSKQIGPAGRTAYPAQRLDFGEDQDSSSVLDRTCFGDQERSRETTLQEPQASVTIRLVSGRYVPAAGREILTPAFDAINAVTMRQSRWRPLLVDRVRTRGATRILDLGCGTGAMAIALARDLPGATVVGIDGDPKVLRRARAKAEAAGVVLELHEAMADSIPLANRAVDCVVSTLVFHHLAPAMKRAALAEVRRVLVPAGSLLVCDIGRAQDPVMRAAFLRVQLLLDGFATTHENARGELPQIIAQAWLRRRRGASPSANRRRHHRTDRGNQPIARNGPGLHDDA